MDRKKIGLMAVALVLVVGVMEVLALKLGSLDFPAPAAEGRSAIADSPGQG